MPKRARLDQFSLTPCFHSTPLLIRSRNGGQLLDNFNERLSDRVPCEDTLVEVLRGVPARARRTSRFHQRDCRSCKTLSILRVYEMKRFTAAVSCFKQHWVGVIAPCSEADESVGKPGNEAATAARDAITKRTEINIDCGQSL